MNPRTFLMSGLAATISCAACAGPATDAGAQPAAEAPVDNAKLVTVKLLNTTDMVKPGDEVVVLLEATIAEGWHTYWNGPSDTGFPLTPKWELPEGWRVVKTEWPVPKRHAMPGEILDHVYEGKATLVVTLASPKDAEPGSSVRLSVDVSWLACLEACIPGHALAELEFKVAPEGAQPTAINIDPLMSARAALAMPLAPNTPIARGTLEEHAGGWVYRIRAGRAVRIRFFPGPDCAPMPNLFTEGDVAGTESTLTVEAKEEAVPRIQGIVQIVYPPDATSGKPGRVSSFSIDTAESKDQSGKNGPGKNQPGQPSAPPAATNPGG